MTASTTIGMIATAVRRDLAGALKLLRPAKFGPRIVMFASDYLPLHDQQSGGLRLKTIIDIIGRTGAPILFISTKSRSVLPGPLSSAAGRKRYELLLRQAGVVEFAYGLREAEAAIKRYAPRLSQAMLSFPHVAEELIPLLRLHSPSCRIIYDTVDLSFLRLERQAAVDDDDALRADATSMKRREVGLVEAADITVAISANERRTLLREAPLSIVEVIPNIFVPPLKSSIDLRDRKGLLFVGGFWHRPNVDAMQWFCADIFPLILKQTPSTYLTIVGSQVTAEVDALQQQRNVRVLGYVEDLVPVFDTARVFVAPLRYGAGMKGKVGQAMAHGLPVVSTTIGAEGISTLDGNELLIRDNVKDFSDGVLALLEKDELWYRLHSSGEKLIADRFSVEAVADDLRQLFES